MELIPEALLHSGGEFPRATAIYGGLYLGLLQTLDLEELGKVAHSTDGSRNALPAPSKLEAQRSLLGGRVPEFLYYKHLFSKDK